MWTANVYAVFYCGGLENRGVFWREGRLGWFLSSYSALDGAAGSTFAVFGRSLRVQAGRGGGFMLCHWVEE